MVQQLIIDCLFYKFWWEIEELIWKIINHIQEILINYLSIKQKYSFLSRTHSKVSSNIVTINKFSKNLLTVKYYIYNSRKYNNQQKFF